MATAEKNAENAIELLGTAFPGKIITSQSPTAYDAEVKKPWSQTCWTKATAFIYLETAEQVAQALSIVKKVGCKFAIRTTGHNPNPGFSSLSGNGVVLDISRLGSKTLTSEGVALIGAGNTWGEVYGWLQEKGLSAIGGRDRQVGVAGFLLGGGLGAFPNLHGLGTDGVENFQVVLADGRIVDANAKENSDLYTALKGGGSNLGIVARFDIKTYPLIKAQYTINLYRPDDYAAINKATIQTQELMESNPNIGLFTNFNQNFVAVGHLYAGEQEAGTDVFASFHSLDSLMSTATSVTDGTLLSLAETLGHAHEQHSLKRAVASATTKFSQKLYDEAHLKWQETVKKLPEGVVLYYTLQPVGTSAVQIGQERGGNILGLGNSPQCWWVFTCEWPQDCSSDALAQELLNDLVLSVQQLAKDEGLFLDFLCMSFASASQKVIRGYGTHGVEKLSQAAHKYDPDQIFQNLQNNGFLIRENLE